MIKNNKGFYIVRAMLVAVLIVSLLGFAGCKSNIYTDDLSVDVWQTDGLEEFGEASYPPYTANDGTWAVYWYICGSDLELR